MTAEKQQSPNTAGKSGGQVKADSQTNPEEIINSDVPVSMRVSSTSEQRPTDGNVQDAAMAAHETVAASGGGNEAKAAETPTPDAVTPPAAKPEDAQNRRAVNRQSDNDCGIKDPVLSDDQHSSPNVGMMCKADKDITANAPAIPGDKDTINVNAAGNQSAAHVEGSAPESPAHQATPGVEYMELSSLEKDPEASGMFERSPAVKDALRQSMKKDGFKSYHPVKAWERDDGSCTPYDGHTRLEIAAELGITKIPVIKTRFAGRKEFLEASINEQVERRNLSIRDKFAVVRHYYPIEAEKARKRHGGQSAKYLADSKGRTDEIIGGKIDCSSETVSKMRFLIDAGNEELLGKIYSDDLSISSAFTTLKPKKAKQKRPDVNKSEGSKNKPGTETEKTIANADKGAKAPKKQEAKPPCGGIPAAANPVSISTGKDEKEGKPAVKAPPVATTHVIQQAIQTPTSPASQRNTITHTYSVPEKILDVLLNLAPKDSRQKIYGLMTNCPQETRNFIKSHFHASKKPSSTGRQSRSNSVDFLTFGKKPGKATHGAGRSAKKKQ
jgi:ParB-like chromosome segregation protein Spo0J